MGSTSQAADGVAGSNAPDDSIVKLGTDEALRMLSQAFEMDWNAVHAQDTCEVGPWPMGRTIWLALFVSTALWACIASIVWLV
jgi:hypothetical protein